MPKPEHTHDTVYYTVLRPCLWFAKGDRVLVKKFQEYFTQKAIKDLLKYEFIEVK